MFAEWTDLVLIYYSSKNNIFEKESVILGYLTSERELLRERDQSEDFDGGLQWLPVDSSPGQALSVALNHLSLIWMAQISDEGQQSEKQRWLRFLFTVLCQNTDDPFKEEFLDSVGRPASSLLRSKTSSGAGEMPRTLTWAREGGNTLLFPAAPGRAAVGTLYAGDHPGGTYLFPSPLAITTMRLVLIPHPQRIQRTKYVFGLREFVFFNYPEALTNCWCYLNNSCACVPGRFRQVQLSETLWTAAHQAPLSMRVLQARILQWVATPSSRRALQPKDQTRVSDVSCFGTRVLYL